MRARLSRDAVNLAIAQLMSQRGTCSRARVGCVIARNGRIISTGYAGAPSGVPHCIDVGCLLGPDGGCIRTSHAEAGAIAFAARHGLALEGASLYVTLSPCLTCAKLIINAGITHVFYLDCYRDGSGLELLQKAGVKITHLLKEES